MDDNLDKIDCDQFIADFYAEAMYKQKMKSPRVGHLDDSPEVSGGEQMIRDAESAKARMYATPGKVNQNPLNLDCLTTPALKNLLTSSVVDEEYMVMGHT